jgi:CubicO group peptidase (beta-lactamase class C family)
MRIKSMKAFLLVLGLTAMSVKAQKNYTASMDSLMAAEVKVHRFNGNVLVAQSGKVLYQKSFGYRDYDSKAVLDNNSVFELASVSKQFTAVAVLQLRDRGKLALTDTLRKFFPELPYANVTVWNMLTHTSGLPDYMEAMATKWDHRKIAFNKDVIHFLATEKVPADFRPGEKCIYSNTAYEMLASIVEKVSGQPFGEYLREHVFKPAGMQDTRIYNTRRSGEKMANYAYGFVYSESLKKYVLPDSLPALDLVYYLDGIVGDGTVNSTTGDLLKWDRALKGHLLLSEATQKEMFTRQHIFDTTLKNYYGYGEFLGENEIGEYINHSGGWPGYHTNLTRYVDKDLTVIVLSNNQSNVFGLTGELAYIATGRSVIIPYEHKAIVIDSSLLDKYTGKYSIPFGEQIEVVRRGGKLFRLRKGWTDIELAPESATKFFYAGGPDQQLEFELDGTGKVSKAYSIYSGMKKEMQR